MDNTDPIFRRFEQQEKEEAGPITPALEWANSNSWLNVDSSNVGSIKYDPESERLWVYFTHAGHAKPDVYVYFAVQLYVASAFHQARSKGTFVHRYLKGRYTYDKLGAGYMLYF